MPLIEFAERPFYNKEESDNPVPWAPYTELDRVRLKKRCEWQRHIVFVKDDDLQGPNYFLIHDDLDGQDEVEPMANFWCLADSQTIDRNLVRWQGQYEVDLDMYVASPPKPHIATRRWSHKASQPTRVTWKNGREEQIAAHVRNQPGQGGFTVLIYPRRRYEVQPRFRSNSNGTALEVAIGERRDVLICTREDRSISFADVECEGTAAVVKLHPAYKVGVLLSGGELSLPGMQLQSEAPVAVRLAGQALVGEAHGGGEMRLALSEKWAGRTLLLNDKPAAKFDDGGRVQVVLPQGGGTMASAGAQP